jgi:hypothetical protein
MSAITAITAILKGRCQNAASFFFVILRDLVVGFPRSAFISVDQR